MIGIPLGLLYHNAAEWFVHKHVLHGWGKKKSSFWSFHFHEHHRNSRTDEPMKDVDYNRSRLGWNAQGKEALALAAVAVAHAPLFPVAPFFVATCWYSQLKYYRDHKRSHEDPEWAREHLSWHYDHHMGPNQDANWCVTRPWFDDLMGTREPYVGTEREQADIEKREARKARRAREAAEVEADKAA